MIVKIPKLTPVSEPTLADVKAKLLNLSGISSRRREDMVSSLHALQKWKNQPLDQIPANIPFLRYMFEELEPAALGVTSKTLSNAKSLLCSAISKSRLNPGAHDNRGRGRKKSSEWDSFCLGLRTVAERNSLSRLINTANQKGIRPSEVNTATLKAMMDEMAKSSLRANQHKVERAAAKAWNSVAERRPDLELQKVAVLPSRSRRTRLPIARLTQGFMQEWGDYSCWGQGEDVFATHRRPAPMSQTTLDIMFQRIHGAISILDASGVSVSSIWGLKDLVELGTFRTLLQHFIKKTKGEPSYEAYFTAWQLIKIAREWVKVAPDHLSEMKRLAKLLPHPEFEMSRKNKSLMRRFDDPLLKGRMISAPTRIWQEVCLETRNGSWRLAEAQAALGIDIQLHMALRLSNLTALKFDEHIHLRSGGISTLVIPKEETKTGCGIEFNISERLAARLLEYRDRIAPTVIGRKPTFIFSNPDGSVKGFTAVRGLLQRYVKSYVGIHLNPHAFRHLAAKLILDERPDAHVVVQHLLGHKKLETTARYYSGRDTLRAGRYYQGLLEKALTQTLPVGRKSKSSKS
ncbi:site-specific integrase [Mesorhizobium sp.]|uniref:site-specific integrase n=1 Tax=Mesorhizobium sp. TaxID=1871066 RepID=UPI0025E45070|nr:site-specific integrase [Mesorhizobium sp.]